MKLPTLNGLETYLALKEINPEVIAIMITAFHQEMDDLVQEAMDNSAYTYLNKHIYHPTFHVYSTNILYC